MRKPSMSEVRYASLSLLGFIALSFQACSPVHVEDLSVNEYEKSSLAEPNLIVEPEPVLAAPLEMEAPPAEPTLPAPTVVAQPPIVQTPVSMLDPREIHCRGIHPDTIPSVIYDSRPVTGSPAKSVKGFLGNRTIDTETVSSVSKFIGRIQVIARTIGTMEGFATSAADFNAQSIGEIQGFVAKDIEIVTHDLREAKNFAADFCLSAHSVGSITNLASRLSLYGRGENGQRSKLGRLGNVAGFISIYNFDIGGTEPLGGAAIKAKLVNSHLTKLENAAVDLILIDSVVDEVANVAGHIHLRGNSEILKIHSSSVELIRD